MRLPANAKRAEQSPNIFPYFQEAVAQKAFWRRDIFGDFRPIFRELFGPAPYRINDSACRRLEVWYVNQPDWPVPFWISSHGERGTSYEVLPDATNEQCLELIKQIAHVLHGK